MKVKISNSPTQNELEEIDLSSTTRRGNECVVGRSPDSDVVLDSDDVSRFHGKFFYQSGNYYFCDLGSRNGTIINGKILEKNHSYILNDGDIIRIGDFALMLEEDTSFSQQSETVVRIINPSMFSHVQRNHNDKVAEVDSSLSQSVNQLEESAKSFVSEAVVNQSDGVETAEEINQNSEEPTFVQPDEEIPEENQINEISDTPVESIENISSTEPEYTIVQPRDIFDENSDEDNNDSTQVETQEDNEDNSDLNLEEDTEPQARVEQEQVDLNEQEIASEREESTEMEVESEQEKVETEEQETEEQEIPQTSEETEITEAESGMIEVTNNEYTDSDMTNTEEVEEELMSEASISTSESVTADSDEVAQETSQETEESNQEEELIIKIAPVLEEKRIVLISHDTKKSELKELISEHEEFLSYCQTITWQTYNDYIYRQTGLSITEDIPPATSGGYQAINSLINSEKIIAVIFLRDLTVPQQGQASEEALLRTCNIREILLANNLPTAQAVIHYLENMES